MSRRRKVVVTIIGGLVVVIGGLIAAFFLSSPTPVELPLDGPTQEIPLDWLDDEAPSTTASEAPDTEPEAHGAGAPTGPTVTTGRLAMIGDGKPFGEETYELVLSEDRATLRSSGRFWFKVVVATVQVTFEQTLEGGADLRPLSYVAEFHAPLGFDRSVRATIEGNRATIERSGGTEEISIEPERTVALGTFSTYVLLPKLVSLRSAGDSTTFEVLVFGGPPHQGSDDSAADELPVMTIERAGSAFLWADDLRLEADRYLVTSDLGESEMYARDDEFLALRAGDEDESLLVYRSDFFPDGIEIVGVTSAR